MYLFSPHNRAFGLFYNSDFITDAWPNAFALFLLLMWPIIFHWFSKKNSSKYKFLILIIKYLAFSLVLSTFFLTFSRAAIIAFSGQVFLLLIYFIINQTRPTLKKISSAILKILILSILTLALIQTAQYTRANYQNSIVKFSERAKISSQDKITSVQERIDFWKGALKLTKSKPWLGYGPMSFNYVYRSIQENWHAVSDHPHNWFLKISAERGIPAVIFFLLFLISIFGQVVKNFKKLNKNQKFITTILSVSILGAIAHNLVDFNMNFATNILIFWIILAILVKSTNTKPQNNTTCIFAIISLLIITLSLTTYESYFTINSFIARNANSQGNYQKAQKHFLIYEGSLFPRYFFTNQAYKEIENQNYYYAEEYYLLHLSKNHWDSATHYKLGELYEKMGKSAQKQNEQYTLALKKDPKNDWRYYYKYIETSNNIDKNFFTNLRNNFANFTPKLEMNLHYIAEKGRSDYAIKVLNQAIQKDPNNKNIYLEYKTKIQKTINKYKK